VKTLVTGATGHIGNTIVRKLLGHGREVRALVRSTSNLAGLKDDQGKHFEGVELISGDVLDPDTLRPALAGCDVVYHTAALFDTRLKDETLMSKINLEGTRNVLELCARSSGLRKVVYTSSVAAVGCLRVPDAVLTEDNWNTDPIDAYVASKLESERLAQRIRDETGLPMVFVNPGTVLGPYDYKPTPSNGFVLLAMKRMPPVYFSGGHSYSDVEDVAEGHLLAEEKGREGERYILAGENISIADLFGRISRRTGVRKPHVKIGHTFVSVAGLGFEMLAGVTGKPPLFTRRKAHKLIDYYGYFSSEKACRELGYRYRSLDEILERCIAWYVRMGWISGRWVKNEELRMKNAGPHGLGAATVRYCDRQGAAGIRGSGGDTECRMSNVECRMKGVE
jgi:dihydroflavonol-4-reductase